MSEKRLWSIREAANFLNVPAPTVRQLLAEGRLPGVKIGKHWRIDPDDLRAWLEEEKAKRKRGDLG